MSDLTGSFIAVLTVLLIFAACLFSGCTASEKQAEIQAPKTAGDMLCQVSSVNILLDGGYDGFVSVGELKKYGDTGLGTVDGLDGELVITGGEFYTVKTDGSAYHLSDDVKIPFADIKFFEEDISFEMTGAENISCFEEIVETNLPSDTIFYAVKMEGTLPYIKTRSVPKQNKPYPRLIEVAKNQTVFEYYNITGTVLGFWSPEFSEGMNVPGLHIHFISTDKTKGGHVLDIKVEDAEVSLDKALEYLVILPEISLGQTIAPEKQSGDKSELSLIEK